MVTVFLANGFEEMEALAPVDLLRRAGIAVQTAAVSEDGSRWITGSHGITVQCDVTAKEVSEQEMEMLVLPGGLPGTTYLDASPEVDRWLRYASEKGILSAQSARRRRCWATAGCWTAAGRFPSPALSQRAPSSARSRALSGTASTSPQRARASAWNLALS